MKIVALCIAIVICIVGVIRFIIALKNSRVLRAKFLDGAFIICSAGAAATVLIALCYYGIEGYIPEYLYLMFSVSAAPALILSPSSIKAIKKKAQVIKVRRSDKGRESGELSVVRDEGALSREGD